MQFIIIACWPFQALVNTLNLFPFSEQLFMLGGKEIQFVPPQHDSFVKHLVH